VRRAIAEVGAQAGGNPEVVHDRSESSKVFHSRPENYQQLDCIVMKVFISCGQIDDVARTRDMAAGDSDITQREPTLRGEVSVSEGQRRRLAGIRRSKQPSTRALH
jgi:hypothetical protein